LAGKNAMYFIPITNAKNKEMKCGKIKLDIGDGLLQPIFQKIIG